MCSEWVAALGPYVVAIAILFGATAAFCGFRVANKTLKLERFRTAATLKLDKFRTAATLMDQKNGHVTRYFGAVVLSELAAQSPDEYEDRVIKGFLAFLKHPPFFADTKDSPKRETDYESVDTVEVVNFLNSRPKSRRTLYRQLPDRAPFKIDDDYCVVPNPGNHSYDAWLQKMEGREPEYDPCDRQG